MIRILLLSTVLSLPGAALADLHEPPNIIFILTDDLGFNQVGVYGDTPIKTPNIDQLARAGIRFTDAYAGNTVCSPSRVSLLTGRDGRLMSNNSNTVELGQLDVTIPEVLKHAGYDTALFGKYSIGSTMGLTDPLSKGFDTWYGMFGILEGHRQYPTFLWRDNTKIRIKENEGGRKGAYAQERFTNEAVKYIREERQNPFFILMSYTSPHAELAAPQRYVDRYLTFDETPYEGMKTGSPSDKYARYYPEPVSQPKATLAAMVTALDDYVGQIVSALEEQGIADNTIIFFTSDNGPHDEGGADPVFFKASAPYKGIKRDLYDGGIHVPMIVYWPKGIPTPRVDKTPWYFADVLPTLGDLAGVNLNLVPRLQSNGLSIRPLLSGEPEQIPERVMYWEFGKQVGDPNSGIVGEVFQAARKGRWKAVRYGLDEQVELYDLESDPGETTDLALVEPDVHAEFVQLFEENAG